jgi:chromosome segregation ATPase
MVLRAGFGRASGAATGGAAADAPPGLPNRPGDLDVLLDHRPVFRIRLQGYDRLEVDNYTAWAESELIAVRRQADRLLSRFGQCSAELEIARRLIADAPPGREAFPVSQRVRDILRLAEDEAAAITETGAQEAAQLLAEARTEADARLRKAHEIKEMAADAAEEILEQARRDRAAAAAAVERARTEGVEILREAVAERERLAAQAVREREAAAAAAAAQLYAVQAEVDDLRRQRDQAQQSLRGLTERIGEALQAVAAMPDEMAASDMASTDMAGTNVAVEGMVRDDRDEPNVVVTVGRPAPVPH